MGLGAVLEFLACAVSKAHACGASHRNSERKSITLEKGNNSLLVVPNTLYSIHLRSLFNAQQSSASPQATFSAERPSSR